MSDKPVFEEYGPWLAARGFPLDDPLRNLTTTNIAAILNAAQATLFFESFQDILDECSSAYHTRTGSHLLAPAEFQLVPKSYDSVVDKSFRQNVTWNRRWPGPPRVKVGDNVVDDWITPTTWYSSIDDLVRGTIVLRYIDGPQFLADWLVAEATKLGLVTRYEPRALDHGYYAYHFYVRIDAVMFAPNWTSASRPIWIELQLTTQLQEVARQLSHRFYESTRRSTDIDRNWKWAFGTDRFKAAYISHSLHLIEALIFELRTHMISELLTGTSSPNDPESAQKAPKAAPEPAVPSENKEETTP